MPWYGVRRGRVEYRGRIDRTPYTAWLSTTDGRAAVAAVAATIRFSLFGRSRAARRRIWRALSDAMRGPFTAEALNEAAVLYGQAVADLAYASGLPRAMAGLRRVVLVPRALAAGRARSTIPARLSRCADIAALGEAVRVFLFDQILREIDAATRLAKPTPKRPVAAGGDWVCVDVDTQVGWVDPVWSGQGWSGHYAVYEQPPSMSRADRKAVERALHHLRSSVTTFPRERRYAIAREAAGA